MYWPIGAPNAYALTKQQGFRSTATESHDSLNEIDDASVDYEIASATASRSPNDTNHISSAPKKPEQQEGLSPRDEEPQNDNEIVAAKASRGGSIFATITASYLTVWQSKPLVALASVFRSQKSMKAYGPSIALYLRLDALIIVVQTSLGYFITYSLSTDPNARVYTAQLPEVARHSRKDSTEDYTTFRKPNAVFGDLRPGEGYGIKEVNLRFRMVVRIDAGISKALALDEELVVATQKPAAIQCIRWSSDSGSSQTSTELVSKMSWITGKCNIVELVHDRPMNLNCWITSDGKAYAVQRRAPSGAETNSSQNLHQGFCFREPETDNDMAIKAAINARFSLIAIGCANGQIDAYTVKDYMGNIPLSHHHKLAMPFASHGKLTFLTYSPDGYCLMAGYEKGWAIWSVYGKAGANTFAADSSLSGSNEEPWLQGARDAFWLGGGCELAILSPRDDRLWVFDMARSAATGCFLSANIIRDLIHTSDSLMMYKGHDMSDVTSLMPEGSLWHTVQVPASYLVHHWPIKCVAVSLDGRYVAVAGRRGLAHYSTSSGRWRTFDDVAAEHEFAVRGGMCWHQHYLIASVETDNKFQIRLYSRDKALDNAHIQHVEELSAPAIVTTLSGTDSLLVYTHDNTLLHYVILGDGTSISLVQVGQIGFHGIIRAPPRVRAISWILPEDQLENGDPSQDVVTASVLFLVDGKLVLLQPSTNEHGELKYDMRVIAQNVEYYILLRDHPEMLPGPSMSSLLRNVPFDHHLGHSLRDSLWFFDGDSFHVWTEIQDVMARAPVELGRDLPQTVNINMDFYPLSAMVSKGVIHGLEADLMQRKDLGFSFFRQQPRTQLFVPHLLRSHLAEYNAPAALHLSHSYQHLPYFPHALEVLLHDILDLEVDKPPTPPETALLPTVISFLSSFACYLDVVVNCVRKTELRSWRTLFTHLPPASELFEISLEKGKLKTAAGYLLVLQTIDQEALKIHESGRLLRRAVEVKEWELCSEVARFLVGIDQSGEVLRSALADAGLNESTSNGDLDNRFHNGNGEHSPSTLRQSSSRNRRLAQNSIMSQDYFSFPRSAEPLQVESPSPSDG